MTSSLLNNLQLRESNMELQLWGSSKQARRRRIIFLTNSKITNKRGRHANLGCHGEEGVSFWGCLFTRKLLQHHGNDPVPFALQQADRQVHSFSHILSKQVLVWFTECFIFLFWKASWGHFLSEVCESLRRRKQNRSRQHVGPDTSWTTKMISLTSESKRIINDYLTIIIINDHSVFIWVWIWKHHVRHWDSECFLTDPFDSEWRIQTTKVQPDRTRWVLTDSESV